MEYMAFGVLMVLMNASITDRASVASPPALFWFVTRVLRGRGAGWIRIAVDFDPLDTRRARAGRCEDASHGWRIDVLAMCATVDHHPDFVRKLSPDAVVLERREQADRAAHSACE